MDRESTPMMTAPPPAILGRFLQVARKTGEIVQEFPIDGERMTIGREPEHNIRLYFQDISKLHAEIVFDLDTGKATLHVHGSNGLDHAPLEGPFTHLKPPAIVALNDKDRIIMRKRLFQFEYATEAERSLANFSPVVSYQALPGSPARQQIAPSSARFTSPMIRHRASKRMSLIPKGKTFVPLTPAKRRYSTLSGELPDAATISRSAIKRTVLATARSESQQAEQEVEVEVVEGENGDMVYLENHEEEEEEVPADFEEAAPSPTPVRAPETPSKVPSKVAMASPRGAYSMHKALLVRSARKAWQETRSPSIEDAIEDGMVQTRRKSSSPRASPRGRSSEANNLFMDGQEGTDGADGVDAVDAQEPTEQQDDFEAADAHREGDSDGDSFEADLSLDFGAVDVALDADMDHDMFTGAEVQANVAAPENQHDNSRQEQEEADMEADDNGSIADEQPAYGTPLISKSLSRFYTPQVKRPTNGPRPSLAAIGGGPARRSSLAVPATPPAQFMLGASTPRSGMMGKPSRRIIATPAANEPEAEEEVIVEVKTMQTPHRDQRDAAAWEETKRRRQSLATPRPLPLPEAGMFRTPLVAAARPLATPLHPALAPSSPDLGDAESPTPTVPATPGNAFRSRLEAAGRQSAQRPAPTSALKARSLFDTEVNRQGRRATVGFALPSTPARRDDGPSVSFTVAKPTTRFAPPTPRFAKPVQENDMEAIEEDEQSMSPAPRTPAADLFNMRQAAQVLTPPVYPALPSVSMHQVTPQRHDFDQQPSTPASEDEAGMGDISTSSFGTPDQIAAPALEQTESGPSTPVYAGLNHLFSTKPAPKTPYMNDIRNLYPSLPEPAKTPSFAGMKTLFAEPAPAPATPLFQGMREMFRQPMSTLPPQTPGMDGLAEMFSEEDDPLAMGSEDEVLGRGESVRSDFGDEDEDEEMLDPGNTSTIIAVSVPVEEEEVSAPTRASSAKSSIPTLKAPTRAKATATAKAKDAPAAAKPAARGRKAAAASAEGDDDPKPAAKAASTKTTSRTATAARTTKSAAAKETAADEPAVAASKIPGPPKARTARTKKVLEESAEQEMDTAAAEEASKPTRAKRPAATTGTTRARKTAALSSTDGTEEPKTAPAKRARGAAAASSAEKENDAPEEVQPAAKTKRAAAASSTSAAVKKGPAARTRKATEEPVAAAAPAPAARVTRSRK